MFFYLFILTIGFILLIKSADWLVDGSVAVARKLNISDLFIGFTVVAFGTSVPELFVNIFASTQGNTDLAIANIVGSNIFNISLILGVSSLIYPLAVSKGTVWKEIPFSLLAVFILGALANDILLDKMAYSTISRIDGFVLISFFAIFLYYIFGISKESDNNQKKSAVKKSLTKPILMVSIGFLGLALGSKLVIDGAVNLASRLGVSQTLIGLTIVATGTSLPELATSAVAAWKKNADIAIGNIVGSNIFNIFLILGVSSLIKPLPINAQINSDILVLIAITIFLFIFMFTGKKGVLDRWEGAAFLICYMIYTFFIIIRG